MRVEEQLKELILENYKSVRAFTTKIGIPYSTISTIFSRGVGGTNVQTVIQICKALNIDVESLSEGKIVKKINTSFWLDEYNIQKDVFPVRLKTLIEQKKDSISTLSKEVSIYIDVLKSFLNGSKIPTVEEIQKLSSYFDVECSYLSGTSGYKKFEEKYESLSKLGSLKSILEGLKDDVSSALIEMFSHFALEFVTFEKSNIDLEPFLRSSKNAIQDIKRVLLHLNAYSSLVNNDNPEDDFLIENGWKIGYETKLAIYDYAEDIKNVFLDTMKKIGIENKEE